MNLPLFQGFTNQVFQLLQTRWTSLLNPILNNVMLQGRAIGPIALVASTPQTINTLLNRMQIGYFITSQNANAVIWQTQIFNTQTLTLESSANVTIYLWVF